MNRYITNVANALKSIESRYFERKERDFTYEFYHQLRSSIDNVVEATGETPKVASAVPINLLQNKFFKKHFYTRANLCLESEKYRRTPDLLLHEYNSRSKQLIAFEVKPLSESKDKILTDIAKLMFYVKGRLNFKKGVLILFSSEPRSTRIEAHREYSNVLVDYPPIEIWIVSPKRVHVIWANGIETNEML